MGLFNKCFGLICTEFVRIKVFSLGSGQKGAGWCQEIKASEASSGKALTSATARWKTGGRNLSQCLGMIPASAP